MKAGLCCNRSTAPAFPDTILIACDMINAARRAAANAGLARGFASA
jgi:hypothetical protein